MLSRPFGMLQKGGDIDGILGDIERDFAYRGAVSLFTLSKAILVYNTFL